MVTYNVSLENKVVLVTGAAGFIGANLVKRLLYEFNSVKVIGIDSITEYYDENIRKKHRDRYNRRSKNNFKNRHTFLFCNFRKAYI